MEEADNVRERRCGRQLRKDVALPNPQCELHRNQGPVVKNVTKYFVAKNATKLENITNLGKLRLNVMYRIFMNMGPREKFWYSLMRSLYQMPLPRIKRRRSSLGGTVITG